MGVNKVILVGRLGKDPESRFSQSQTPITNFSVATGERRKDQTGNWVEHTEWHNVVTFGKTAENCSNFLKKGREVYIEGRIQTRKWQDKEGKDRWTTEIIANQVQFLGGRDGAGAGDYSGGGSNGASDPLSSLPSADSLSGGGDVSFDDDDIPF
ncbi:MAG: single-stranded DNA-binding protein [Bdellovibrionales bacterium]|nr:single-stranded DNA-binding protein [Bdellovibrionales bacterium]